MEITGSRTCVFCRRSWPLGEVNDDEWSTVPLGDGHLDEHLDEQPPDEYHRCPDCTAADVTEPGAGSVPAQQDEARSPISAACDAALQLAVEKVEEHGGKVIAGFLMLHVDGMTPNAGMEFLADEDEGPQDGDDMLAFLVNGVGAFAAKHGLPFRVMQMGADSIGAEG